MNPASGSIKQQKLFSDILTYVAKARGLRAQEIAETEGRMVLRQTADGKTIAIRAEDLEDVLMRSDAEGEEFLQVNFMNTSKILVTTSLIGFKPCPPKGLDASRLPRVVTTPDIVNVFEAVQDALQAPDSDAAEISILKKVFDAVLVGGESVGFNLSTERSWVARIFTAPTKISS